MSQEGRHQFLVPISIAGYIGAILLLVGIDVYTRFFSRASVNPGDVTLFIVLALPLVVWFVFRFAQVIRSNHRYNRRGKSSAA
jgi:hypothetical protein